MRKQTRKEELLRDEGSAAVLNPGRGDAAFLTASRLSRGKAALWVGDHATDSPDAELVVPEGQRYGRCPD